MVNWKALWIEIFAVVASYLVITTSTASAVPVRTYDPSGMEYGSPIQFNPGGLVERDVSVSPETETLVFVLRNGSSSVSLEGAWLYRCRERNPHECMESVLVGMDAFSGNVDVSYGWDDISGDGVANLLCFVKIDDGGVSLWKAFWTVVERDGETFTVHESDISEVRVYARDVGILPTMREFIRNRLMVPSNPEWISRIVFQGASSLYEIGIGGEGDIDSQPNTAGYQEISGDELGSITREYGFVLPVTPPGVNNPVTLYLNPSYTCGMFGCEEADGEDSGNCCLDCPCGDGYYCDSHHGCRPVDGIGLSIFGTVNPVVENCFESHTVSIPVKIGNAPTGHSVAEGWCKLGGVFSSCDCTGASGDVYVCPVEVQPVAGCGSGEFRITDNAIRLRVGYMDGETPRERYVETAFPDVTIGSFVCGQGGCEPALGEDWECCCYDCPCPSGYCDYLMGDEPDSGICREDLDSGDVSKVGGYEPGHFYSHNAGDQVSMNIVVSNKPKTFRLDGVSCEMGCVYDYTETCGSDCAINCIEVSSSDPGKYNMTCTVTFSVPGYSPLSNYDLTPKLTLDVFYRNGTYNDIFKSIATTLGYFSIGPHWCGDGECGADESYDTCCYDCPCPGGQYCDTRDIEGPSEGDGCRDGFGLGVDSVGSLNLVDSTKEHEIPVSMHVEDYPSATDMGDFVFGCMIESGDVDCSLSCEHVASNDPEDYNLSCWLTVPIIDYVDSIYFDEAAQEIRLDGNGLNIGLYYNNGPVREFEVLDEPLGEIVIEVTTSCGVNGCEPWEDQATCCRDCNCSDFGDGFFCYQGPGYPNGECINESEIGLDILGFDPYPWECLIGRLGGNCTYVKGHIVNTHIMNSPGDLEIIDVFYRIDGGEPTEMDCKDTATYGNWDCSFIPDSLEGVENGIINRTFNISMSVNYSLNGMATVREMSAFNETIGTSIRNSDALESCMSRIDYITDSINRLKSNQGDYGEWGWIYIVMGLVTIAIGVKLLMMCFATPPCGPCCWMGPMMIATGLIMLYVAKMSQDTGVSLDNQIEYFEDMKKQLEDYCSSTEFEEAALAGQGMQPVPPVNYPS
jgi:hypothetical protein